MAQEHSGRSQAAEGPSAGPLATAGTAHQPSTSRAVGSLRHLPDEQLGPSQLRDYRMLGGVSAAPASAAASHLDQQLQQQSLPAATGGDSHALSDVSAGSLAPAVIRPQPAPRDGAGASSAGAPAVIRPQPANSAAAVLGAASAAPTVIRPQRAAQHLPILAEDRPAGSEATVRRPGEASRQGSPELLAARSAASVVSEAPSRESQPGGSVHEWTEPGLHPSVVKELVCFAECPGLLEPGPFTPVRPAMRFLTRQACKAPPFRPLWVTVGSTGVLPAGVQSSRGASMHRQESVLSVAYSETFEEAFSSPTALSRHNSLLESVHEEYAEMLGESHPADSGGYGPSFLTTGVCTASLRLLRQALLLGGHGLCLRAAALVRLSTRQRGRHSAASSSDSFMVDMFIRLLRRRHKKLHFCSQARCHCQAQAGSVRERLLPLLYWHYSKNEYHAFGFCCASAGTSSGGSQGKGCFRYQDQLGSVSSAAMAEPARNV